MTVKSLYMTLQVMAADDPKRKQLIDRMIEATLEPDQTGQSSSNEVVPLINREEGHTNVNEGLRSVF